MTYTTTQLSELTGYTSSMITTILKKEGYTHLDTGDHGVKIWEEECLGILNARRESENVRPVSIGISFLAQKHNVSNKTIRGILKNKKIEPLYIDPVKKVETYPIIADDVLREHFDDLKCAEESEHPLVKDKRCLKDSWFPDVVPKCFEDLDIF